MVLAPLSSVLNTPCRIAASIISGGAKPKVNAISRSGKTGVSAVEGMERTFTRLRSLTIVPPYALSHPISARDLIQFLCPLLAQSGHYATEFQCPLLGVKRTSPVHSSM